MIQSKIIDLAEYLRKVEHRPEAFLQGNVSGRDLYQRLGKVHAMISLSRWQEAEVEALDLLEAAIEQNEQLVLSAIYLAMSEISVKLGFVYREQPYLEQALEAAKDAQNHDYIAITLCKKAAYHQKTNKSKHALDCLALASEQISESTSLRAMFMVFRDSGTVLNSLKLYHKALDSFVKALELSVKLKDVQDQLRCLLYLCSIYTMLADYEAAKHIVLEGIELSKAHSEPIRRLNFMFSMGAMQLKRNELNDALQSFLECKAFAEEIGFLDNQFQIELGSNLAGCYGFLERNEEALEAIDNAIRAASETANLACVHELNINRAKILSQIGSYAEAQCLLKKAISFSRKANNFEMLKVALSNLSLACEMQNDYKKAIKYLRELNRAYQSHLIFVMQQQGKKHEEEISAVIDELHGIKKHVQRSFPALSELQDTFVGFSEIHKDILSRLLKAAQHPSTNVLITGETGTGKDVMANLIHQNSVRRDALFLPVNMAAISENLMESMFFGHKKGAFTGANQDHKGFFLEAHKGSIYLDEISEMPLYLQAKLLRALETGKVTPVGSTKEVAFDTRIICSSNRDLSAYVESGSFRMDLFYRLNTITISIPPLRDRLLDLEPLVLYFTTKYCKEMYKKLPKIEESFTTSLRNYSFPGNIRELRNIIEHMVIMHDGKVWTANSLDSLNLRGHQQKRKPFVADPHKAEEEEKKDIITALKKCHGKQKDAAILLGTSEPTLTRRIKKYNLGIYTKKNSDI